MLKPIQTRRHDRPARTRTRTLQLCLGEVARDAGHGPGGLGADEDLGGRGGVLDEGARRLLGDLEGRVAVDVEPGAAGEEEDVVGEVEDGGDGGQGEEEEDEGPCVFFC